jgi:hypothetical protein
MDRKTGSGRGVPALDEVADWGEALRAYGEEAREAIGELAERLEIERRMRESPMTVLAAAAGVGFVLGGGLWPVLRPLVKTAARMAMSPANLIAMGAALGAIRAAGEPEEVPASEPGPGTAAH